MGIPNEMTLDETVTIDASMIIHNVMSTVSPEITADDYKIV